MSNKLIFTIIIGFTIMFSGCVDSNSTTYTQSNSPTYTATYSHDQYSISEYNDYIETFNQDVISLNNIRDEWNRERSTVDRDNRITSEEFRHMRSIAQENLHNYNSIKNHRSNFYNFIVNNEGELRKLGIDVYTMKNSLSDSLTSIESNSQIMEDYLESDYYYEYHEYSYESTTTTTTTTTTY